MKAKASVLTLRVPFELKHKIEQIADQQGISINQLALYIFTKEIHDLETSQYLSKYWNKKSKTAIINDFNEVMKKIKRKPVPEWDKVS